jgi:hypothetical protein
MYSNTVVQRQVQSKLQEWKDNMINFFFVSKIWGLMRISANWIDSVGKRGRGRHWPRLSVDRTVGRMGQCAYYGDFGPWTAELRDKYDPGRGQRPLCPFSTGATGDHQGSKDTDWDRSERNKNPRYIPRIRWIGSAFLEVSLSRFLPMSTCGDSGGSTPIHR